MWLPTLAGLITNRIDAALKTSDSSLVDILRAVEIAVLALIDLSVAFNTVDHEHIAYPFEEILRSRCMVLPMTVSSFTLVAEPHRLLIYSSMEYPQCSVLGSILLYTAGLSQLMPLRRRHAILMVRNIIETNRALDSCLNSNHRRCDPTDFSWTQTRSRWSDTLQPVVCIGSDLVTLFW